MTPDVNVLVAAFRPDHSDHRVARRWLTAALRDCGRGAHGLRLLPVVVAGFLRIVTHPRILAEPDAPGAAVGFVDAMAATPGVEMAGGTAWPGLRAKVLTLALTGNAIPDAWIAAEVEHLSEHLVTMDRDFKRLLPTRSLTLLSPDP